MPSRLHEAATVFRLTPSTRASWSCEIMMPCARGCPRHEAHSDTGRLILPMIIHWVNKLCCLERPFGLEASVLPWGASVDSARQPAVALRGERSRWRPNGPATRVYGAPKWPPGRKTRDYVRHLGSSGHLPSGSGYGRRQHPPASRHRDGHRGKGEIRPRARCNTSRHQRRRSSGSRRAVGVRTGSGASSDDGNATVVVESQSAGMVGSGQRPAPEGSNH